MVSVVLSPSPVQQYFDNNGALLTGGRLFTYEAGTTTKQAAYSDSSGDTPLPNPIVLNSRGEIAPSSSSSACGLWLDSTLTYKFVLAPAGTDDPPTSPIWTIDDVVNPVAAVLAALASYESMLSGVPSATIIPYGGSSAPTGWLLCFGQAISRTTFSVLFGIIGTMFGVGDGSSTFNVPDLRGRAPFGQDNMGGSAADRITSGGSGEDGTVLGNAGGNELMQQHLHDISDPGHTHTITDPGHIHPIGLHLAGTGGGTVANTIGTDAFTLQTQSATTGISGANSNTTGITATENTGTGTSTGGSQNMPPNLITTYIIKT